MVLKLVNLTKQFNKKAKSDEMGDYALDNVNIEFTDAKIISVFGPAYCGKSELIYLISGLDNADSGNIIIDGEDITEYSIDKRNIGVVLTDYSLYPHMSVLKNITYPLRNKKEANPEVKAMEYIELLGLGDLVSKKPKHLSLIEQFKVALARAIVKKPGILLLDDPYKCLKEDEYKTCSELIKLVQEKTNITIMLVTGNEEEALTIADQVVLLEKGVVQQIGKPDEVINNPINEFVANYTGKINTIPAIYDDSNVSEEEIYEKVLVSDDEDENQFQAALGILKFGTQTFEDDITPVFGKRMILTKDTHIGVRPDFIELKKDGKYQMNIIAIDNMSDKLRITFKLPGIDEVYLCYRPLDEKDNYKLGVENFNFTNYYIFDFIGRRLR